MKKFAILLVVAAGAFAAGYVIVSNKQSARFENERATMQSAWESERAALERALSEARQRQPSPVSIPAPTASATTAAPSPQEILDKLVALKPVRGAAYNLTMRQAVHQLQVLAETGAEALPVIRNFLARQQDVEYLPERQRSEWVETEAGSGDPRRGERGGREGWGERFMGRRSEPDLDFVFPPSLRLGLVDVLKQLGGNDAQQVLAELLGRTGRAIEVAYVARVLESMAPNQYRDLALTAAKDLLVNPPSVQQPTRLDENAKAYLYSVLSFYEDTSFAATAQALLIDAEGHLDQHALNYLNSTLKDQAVPALYQAYRDPRVTNVWEKASLARLALQYAGANPQANNLFKEIVSNGALPTWMRALPMLSLGGTEGRGPFRSSTPAPTDPQTIQYRLQLLEETKPWMADERMVRAWVEARQNLQNLLAGDAGPEVGRGGRRNRESRIP